VPPRTRPPSDISIDLLEEKWRDFTHFQVWPLRSKLDPEGWLNNFTKADLPFAYHLLNSFMFFSESVTNQLFLAAVQHLSQLVPGCGLGASGNEHWNNFLDSVLITYVTGEIPHPTDSGYMFSRKARDLIVIPQTRIVEPAVAIERVIQGSASPLVFVDDFVGSGNQFCETWHRTYAVGGSPTSFATLRASGALSEAYYCPPICTEKGLTKIETFCPGVIVSAGNVLGDQYSVFHPQSLIWPVELRATGPEFVRRVSQEVGIPADSGEWDYRGFHHLGLALAFAHKTPDATIPLFRWNVGAWQPLVIEG
jgi:hypothetical protein